MLLIYAYETQYGGLHGISTYTVLEEDNIKLAEEIGRDLSIEVIQEFGLEEGMDEEDIEESIAYEIYKINNTAEKTIDELDRIIFKCGVDNFIKNNCVLLN